MPQQIIVPKHWASDRPTLLDIATVKAGGGCAGLIDEAARAVPEITHGFARTIKGTTFSCLVRKTLPKGGFRKANAGAVRGRGDYENRQFPCMIFNPRWDCDVAVADRCEDGPEAYIAMEASAMVTGSLMNLATQLYYGVNNDADGFPGLHALVDDAYVHDATGTTGKTSVWGIKWGANAAGWLWGAGGDGIAPSEVRRGDVMDANSKPFTAYIQEILAHVGIQVADIRSVCRIKNISEEANKTLTDAMIGKMLAKLPVGMKPDMLFMTPRSLEQLRTSRSAYHPTGSPVPTPESYEGIPIHPTDSISNAETV